ncbi:MAG: hypothetical protein M5U01_08825 [Ardenticatenaceae bacterium]|nr:hypothetical protein [Ardenticatenaceae bacterium]
MNQSFGPYVTSPRQPITGVGKCMMMLLRIVESAVLSDEERRPLLPPRLIVLRSTDPTATCPA